tara:strand:- start:12410 stop:13240 length:831 start_codon:yes stop_codon:yes gene_type:complete
VSILISTIYSYTLNDRYSSESVLQFVYQDFDVSDKSLSGASGIASIFGIGGSSTGTSMDLLSRNIAESKDFFEIFYENDETLKNLMAIKYYDKNLKKIIFNENIYNSKEKEWVRKSIFFNISKKPTFEESYNFFHKEVFKISHDKESDLVTFKVKHESPEFAYLFSKEVIKNLNNLIRTMKVNEAEKSITFLENKLNQSNISYLQNNLSQLIEQKIQTIMLSEISDDFVYKTIDSPRIAEKKESPNRLILVLLGAIAGFILGAFLLIFLKTLSKLK